jgi:GMP synthase-like glutamine amidotransferase
MATCLVVQHKPPESAFVIEDAITGAGVRVDTREVFAGDSIPRSAAGFDGLVVMGGPMSAISDDGFPTRRAELALMSDAVDIGVPTLGVCLGAQLLAALAVHAFIGESGVLRLVGHKST